MYVCTPFIDLLFAYFEVHHQKYDAYEDAGGADDEVGDAQERVLTAQPRRRRQYHALSAVKRRHWICCTTNK